MDKDIKEYMKRLGDAINEAIQDSERIQRILQDVEERGYSLSLSLALVVGMGNLSHRKGKPPVPRDGGGEGKERAIKPTPFDRRFLKALRIKFSEEQL